MEEILRLPISIRFGFLLLSLVLLGCGSSDRQDTPQGNTGSGSDRLYTLQGKVVSKVPETHTLVVDHGDIPGFMAAMTMPYQVKDATALDKLSPRDRIKAEIVVGNEGAYLENIGLTQKAPTSNPTK